MAKSMVYTARQFYLDALKLVCGVEHASSSEMQDAEDFGELLSGGAEDVFYRPGSSSLHMMFGIPEDKRSDFELMERDFMSINGYSFSGALDPIWSCMDMVDIARSRLSGLLSSDAMDYFFYWFKSNLIDKFSISEIRTMSDKDLLVLAIEYIASEQFDRNN